MTTLQEIQKQITELQQKAQAMVQAQRQPIIDKMKEEIKTYGITASELGFKGKRGRKPSTSEATTEKTPVAPKYRKGENTWTGRGRAPTWITEHEASGGKRDDLLIVK
jgi:DNA-binding protein H-NS